MRELTDWRRMVGSCRKKNVNHCWRDRDHSEREAMSSLQQVGCLLPPPYRRPSDRCEIEDRPQAVRHHVHQVPYWSFCNVPLRHISSGRAVPSAELPSPPEPLKGNLACWHTSEGEALRTLVGPPAYCNVHQVHRHCCSSEWRRKITSHFQAQSKIQYIAPCILKAEVAPCSASTHTAIGRLHAAPYGM